MVNALCRFVGWIRGDLVFLECAGVRDRTFFVPGLVGFGTSSLFNSVFPYFNGIVGADVVDVGPVSPVCTRADALYDHIVSAYPLWSAERPINLVGHSMGANTIYEMVARYQIPADHINRIVLVSPVSLGFSNTYVIGRNNRPRTWLRLVAFVLRMYEALVPAWVRTHLFLNTMLPPGVPWFGGDLGWSIVPDISESSCATVYRRFREHTKVGRWDIRTIALVCSVERNKRHALPISPNIPLATRLTSWVLGMGNGTDYDVGYTYDGSDVGRCVLRNGPHDGVVSLQSQLGLSPTVAEGTRTLSGIDHVSGVLGIRPLLPQRMFGTYTALSRAIMSALTEKRDVWTDAGHSDLGYTNETT